MRVCVCEYSQAQWMRNINKRVYAPLRAYRPGRQPTVHRRHLPVVPLYERCKRVLYIKNGVRIKVHKTMHRSADARRSILWNACVALVQNNVEPPPTPTNTDQHDGSRGKGKHCCALTPLSVLVELYFNHQCASASRRRYGCDCGVESGPMYARPSRLIKLIIFVPQTHTHTRATQMPPLARVCSTFCIVCEWRMQYRSGSWISIQQYWNGR